MTEWTPETNDRVHDHSATQEPADVEGTAMTLVLCVHRSGSSMTAAGLEAIGLNPGARRDERDVHNPKGYFEHWQVREFNDALLKHLGSSWDDAEFDASRVNWDDATLEIRRREAVELMRTAFPTAGHFVLKDPRVSPLLPFWNEVLSDLRWEARHVLVLRSPDEVVESLRQRVERGFPGPRDESILYRLWTGTMTTILGHLPPNGVVTLRHDALRSAPATVLAELARSLGKTPDSGALERYANDFVEAALHRSGAPRVIPSTWRDHALALWERCRPEQSIGRLGSDVGRSIVSECASLRDDAEILVR